eukprot:1537341-Karenia_brevis.AAC.1
MPDGYYSHVIQEVPYGLICAAEWKLLYAGRWKHDEPIHVEEARGPLWSLRRLCKQRQNHDVRYLILNDNLGMALALEKGRASDPRILGICRRWAAS